MGGKEATNTGNGVGGFLCVSGIAAAKARIILAYQ